MWAGLELALPREVTGAGWKCESGAHAEGAFPGTALVDAPGGDVEDDEIAKAVFAAHRVGKSGCRDEGQGHPRDKLLLTNLPGNHRLNGEDMGVSIAGIALSNHHVLELELD